MLVIASVERPKPSISSPTQPRTRFQSQKPNSIQFLVAKPNFRKSGSSPSQPSPASPAPTEPPKPSLSNPTQPSQIQINLQSQNSTNFKSQPQPQPHSPQPQHLQNEVSTRPSPSPSPGPAQHQIFQNQVSVRKPAQNVSLKTFLAPKPLTISINSTKVSLSGCPG